MGNLSLYEAVRKVPDEAKTPIQGGRLKGKTDINPMWRIKVLTEQFGVYGFGWYYDIKSQRLEPGANGEVACFVDIDLYVKMGAEWSMAVPGLGGAMFIAKEKDGYFTDDDCYKKALTDALSVACKALGIGADVYYHKDVSKYDRGATTGKPPAEEYKCAVCGKEFKGGKDREGKVHTAKEVYEAHIRSNGKAVCKDCMKKAAEAKGAA